MISTGLIKILSKFTADEFKEFGEFINSPFFNKNKNVITLYGYLKKYYPGFDFKFLDKKMIYRRLFNKGGYNDGFMRILTHNMNKLCEDFLSYRGFFKKEVNKKLSLLEELNERKLDKAFVKAYKETKNILSGEIYRGAEFFYNEYRLYEHMEEYMDWSKYKNKDYKSFTFNTLTYISDDLTKFYLSKVLNHYRFIANMANYQKINYNFDFLDHIMEFLLADENRFTGELKIKLHMREILLIKEKKEEHYEVLKDILIKNKDQLNHSDRYSLHNILQGYCTYGKYKGYRGYLKERFGLYKICLAQKLYAATEHVYFDDLMFANIALTALSLGEYNWTEKFIDKYKTLLAPDNSEIVVKYSQARLCFTKKEFEKTIQLLDSIKVLKHIQFKMPVRDLTLMAHYELSQFSHAFYRIDSYRHFLKNNKETLSKERFERISNFLKFYTKLAKLKEKNIFKGAAKLKKEIQSAKNTLETNWLLEKLNEAEKK